MSADTGTGRARSSCSATGARLVALASAGWMVEVVDRRHMDLRSDREAAMRRRPMVPAVGRRSRAIRDGSGMAEAAGRSHGTTGGGLFGSASMAASAVDASAADGGAVAGGAAVLAAVSVVVAACWVLRQQAHCRSA